MRPDFALRPSAARAAWSGLTPAWRGAIARLAAVWAVLIVVFWTDWRAMALQWWDSSTYNHVLLVPAILVWLVWQRYEELVKIAPRTWWPPLLAIFAAGFLWLLGAFSGLDLARQAGAVGLLMASVPLLLGPRASLGLLFPLAYMVFLVPFGDIFVPALQLVTAEITIFLVNLSGIAAHIDGVFIDTQAGLFEVAEACSGVKFLIAMVAFGVLAGNVCFVSWPRRFAMVAACIIVPILANGVRAWGTIYAAQYVGVERAAGIDHLVYGWIFFALVLALVIAGAWRFFDRPGDVPPIDAAAIRAMRLPGWIDAGTMRPATALAAFAAILAVFQLWAFRANALEAPLPGHIDLPEVPGWHRVDYTPTVWWEPRAGGADHRLLGRYADGKGRTVDIFFALYGSQAEGKEAGGFGEGALTPDTDWSWQSPAAAIEGGRSERLIARGVGRLAVTWYRSGDLVTGSNARLKLDAMRARLLLDEAPTAMLILSSEAGGAVAPAESIAAFRAATGPLGPWMDRVSGIE
ncbi:exosortase A [Novosphingobium sp. PC22D]|uniref:exosortase A n=1 Tax=Novosphingobium sp. PC22D TaxID=1962403 RepID=UPI000BF04A4D|nr:exosortase A [Novosphingobium sp. PC22D]PEQ10625.1 exosortase A [Novosphingobium sp. PC22D]